MLSSIKKKMLIYTVIILFFIESSTGKIITNAQEQAQVIYDFIEIVEDTATYTEPDLESSKGELLKEGEKVLVISTTADGWYQILYHSEVFYFPIASENTEEMEISADVIEEIKEEKEKSQDLTKEEVKNLIEDKVITSGKEYDEIISEIEIREENQKVETVPKILLGILFFVVVFSGVGYLVLKKKENSEQIENSRERELVIENLDAEDEE